MDLVESLQRPNENPTEWLFRRAFLLRNWNSGLPRDRMECLSNCFINSKLYGASYPDQLMEELEQRSKHLVQEVVRHRNAIRKAAQRSNIQCANVPPLTKKGKLNDGSISPSSSNGKIEASPTGQSELLSRILDIAGPNFRPVHFIREGGSPSSPEDTYLGAGYVVKQSPTQSMERKRRCDLPIDGSDGQEQEVVEITDRIGISLSIASSFSLFRPKASTEKKTFKRQSLPSNQPAAEAKAADTTCLSATKDENSDVSKSIEIEDEIENQDDEVELVRSERPNQSVTSTSDETSAEKMDEQISKSKSEAKNCEFGNTDPEPSGGLVKDDNKTSCDPENLEQSEKKDERQDNEDTFKDIPKKGQDVEGESGEQNEINLTSGEDRIVFKNSSVQPAETDDDPWIQRRVLFGNAPNPQSSEEEIVQQAIPVVSEKSPRNETPLSKANSEKTVAKDGMKDLENAFNADLGEIKAIPVIDDSYLDDSSDRATPLVDEISRDLLSHDPDLIADNHPINVGQPGVVFGNPSNIIYQGTPLIIYAGNPASNFIRQPEMFIHPPSELLYTPPMLMYASHENPFLEAQSRIMLDRQLALESNELTISQQRGHSEENRIDYGSKRHRDHSEESYKDHTTRSRGHSEERYVRSSSRRCRCRSEESYMGDSSAGINENAFRSSMKHGNRYQGDYRSQFQSKPERRGGPSRYNDEYENSEEEEEEEEDADVCQDEYKVRTGEKKPGDYYRENYRGHYDRNPLKSHYEEQYKQRIVKYQGLPIQSNPVIDGAQNNPKCTVQGPEKKSKRARRKKNAKANNEGKTLPDGANARTESASTKPAQSSKEKLENVQEKNEDSKSKNKNDQRQSESGKEKADTAKPNQGGKGKNEDTNAASKVLPDIGSLERSQLVTVASTLSRFFMTWESIRRRFQKENTISQMYMAANRTSLLLSCPIETVNNQVNCCILASQPAFSKWVLLASANSTNRRKAKTEAVSVLSRCCGQPCSKDDFQINPNNPNQYELKLRKEASSSIAHQPSIRMPSPPALVGHPTPPKVVTMTPPKNAIVLGPVVKPNDEFQPSMPSHLQPTNLSYEHVYLKEVEKVAHQASQILENTAGLFCVPINYETIGPNAVTLHFLGRAWGPCRGRGVQLAKRMLAESALQELRSRLWTMRVVPAPDFEVGKPGEQEGGSGQKRTEGSGGQKPLGPENVGHRLLMKMGWEGQGCGLGKEGQGLAEPPGLDVKVIRRAGIGHKDGSGAAFREYVRGRLHQFLCDPKGLDTEDLCFSPDFSAEERAFVHQECRRQAGVESRSYNSPDGRRWLVVMRKRTPRQLFEWVMRHGGQTTRYKLFPPGTHPSLKLAETRTF